VRRVVKKIFLVLFFALGTLQPLFSLIKILLYGRLFEYNFTYLRAAEATLMGKSIYSFGDINYPPPALFLFIFLHFLPVFWGQIVWSFFSLGCLLLALYFSFKILQLDWKWQNLSLILPLSFLAFPIKWTFGLGQINNLILLLLVLGFYFDLPKSPMDIGQKATKKQTSPTLRRSTAFPPWRDCAVVYCYGKGKSGLAGLSLGVATCLKIIPGIFLLYFLLKKQFKVFVFGVILVTGLFLGSGWCFGFNLWREYFTKVIPATFEIGRKDIYYNQAVSGFFSRMIGDGNQVAMATAIFSFLVLAVTIYSLCRQKGIDAFGCSLIISAILLINSFSWQHHFVWLVFPFLTVFAYLKRNFDRKLPLLTFFAYLLVAINLKRPELLMGNFFGKIFVSHVFLGNFLLWLLLMFIMQRDEKIFH